jgi:hypothetical protein
MSVARGSSTKWSLGLVYLAQGRLVCPGPCYLLKKGDNVRPYAACAR